MEVKGSEIVEKRNVLNEITKNEMSLQELRFFSIYLAKINSRDMTTRVVKFKLEEFQKIMNLGKMNIKSFEETTNKLLCKIVRVPRKDGSKGYDKFQLFKKCSVYEDKEDFNQWYVEIDAHDEALPLMFEFKDKYFRYALWNVLRLTSRNQLRMYELLKQYELIGMREIRLEELKDWLGIKPEEYPRWDNFKKYVIESCQKALAENTDIKFDYETIKSRRSVIGVRFLIKKNKNYKDPLKLNEYIDAIPVYRESDLKKPKIDPPTKAKKSPTKSRKKFDTSFQTFTIEDLENKVQN